MPATPERDIEGTLGAAERRLSFLLEASSAVSEAWGYADTLKRLARVAVPELADLCLIDVIDEDGSLQRMAAVHADPAKQALVAELGERYSPVSGSAHPTSEVIATGKPSWSPTMPDPFLRDTTRDERHFRLVKALGFASYMCVPLMVSGDVVGSITLVSAGSGRQFSAADLELPQELATRVATVVGTARRYDREHEIAIELQRQLLPTRLPEIPGVEIAVRYLTGDSGAAAGGDFYDVVVLPSGRLGLVIGDVEGHDTVAAAVMGQLRSATRALAGQFREPSALVDALQWSWELLGFERSATGVFSRLDPSNGEFVAASAGHPQPLLLDAGGSARLLPVEAAPLLGAPGLPAVDFRCKLAAGDTLVLYTDGLVEIPGVSLTTSESLLIHAAEAASARSPEQVCDALLADLLENRGRRDDVALLAIRWLG